MRDCERNKVSVYYTNSFTEEEEIVDGFFTGKVVRVYEKPKKIKINLYPANGNIVKAHFGDNYDFDMTSVSTEDIFTPDSLVFLNKPTDDKPYDTQADFKIEKINKSLNQCYYGLKRCSQ